MVVYNSEKASKEGFSELPTLVSILDPEIEVYALTSTDGAVFGPFLKEVGLDIPFFYADATVLKTIVRANPGSF